MNSPDRSNTPAAITVTYEPDENWSERFRVIVQICPRCVVVDNSISEEGRVRVRSTLDKYSGVELISNPDNPGIGRALNQGCRALQAAGYIWVIAFDQDSVPQPGFVEALLTTARTLGSKSVAVVGANWRDLGRPDHLSRHLSPGSFLGGFRRLAATHDLSDVLCVITSGSLFSLRAWHALGGFDESLFLDLVDTDYCLRARRAGWAVSVSAQARLDHRRGDKRPRRFLGWTHYPSFIPPSRLCSLSRNRLLLFARHGGHESGWVAYELIYATKLLADILFFEDQKVAKLAAFFRGTLRGLSIPHQDPHEIL